MPISVTVDEYWNALSTALDALNTNLPLSHQRGSDQALSAVLAWAWDSIPSSNAIDGLGLLNCSSREVALTLIAGRCHYGRPADHPRRDDIERFHRHYHHGLFEA